jgi:hypothetical protein
MSAAHEADGVVFRAAGPADDADLRAALRENALPSWATMSLRREPSFFAGEGLMGESAAVIAREAAAPHRPVGMYTCAFAPVHVDGAPETVGYLGGLRVNAPYRRRPRVVRNGFASIPVVVGNRGGVPFWFTSVSRENSAAVRLLEAGLPGMPTYRRAGLYETWTMATSRGRGAGVLRRARREDAAALAAFHNARAARRQFSPVLSADWLLSLDGSKGLTLGDFWLAEDASGLRACLAVWDQRAFKQTVAAAYRFPLSLLRAPYNLWAAASRRAPLPRVGRPLEHVFLAFAAFAGDDDGFALSIVREALARAAEKGASSAVLGLAAGDPLGAAIRARLSPHRYASLIETVTWPGEPAAALDGRPVSPEAALL